MGIWEQGNSVKEARRKTEKDEMCKFFFFFFEKHCTELTFE